MDAKTAPQGVTIAREFTDKETAKQFLAQLSIDEMPAFFDFALEEARRTNFDVQTLGGIKPYFANYLATRERQAADKSRAAAHRTRMQADDEIHMIEARKLTAARRLFDTLPEGDRQLIRAEAETKAQRFPTGPLRDSMIEHLIARIVADL